MKKTNRVDWESPNTNVHGCLPCPKCGSVDRYVLGGKIRCGRKKDGEFIDGCGFKEAPEYADIAMARSA